MDRVLPSADYRQFVLSFPYPLRGLLARDPAFLSRMLSGFLRSVFAWQRHRGRKAGITDGQTGAISFVQRFGSAVNLNVHIHSIAPSGLFVPGTDGKLVFVPLPPPTDDDVARLTHRIARRLTKVARRHLADAGDEILDADDERVTLHNALDTALRPTVRPQPALPLGGAEPPQRQKPLCTAVGGFSLHAARTVEQRDREGLERLCRYGMRAPFAQQRLSILPDGRVRYELPRPWPTPTGVTELVMEPLQFLKRLAALLPAPYQNLVRYHGVFANRSRWRPLLPAPPEATADAPRAATATHACSSAPADDLSSPGTQTELGVESLPGKHEQVDLPTQPAPSPTPAFADVAPNIRPRRLPWAALLRRTLGVDGDRCPSCGTQMVLLALITARVTVSKILDHLDISSSPPPIAPARDTNEQSELLQDEHQCHDAPGAAAHAPQTRNRTVCSRAPP